MPENSEQNNKDNLQSRPPIVVVLGHVDHGKTSVLDYIRKSHVAAKESGGITQHIGAYEIEHNSKTITFIDTPGHEAFSAMRSRGAKVADIAILVVAAEEGVKPQTKEAVLHIKKAGIPLIVAINKIDKTEADPEKVRRELMQLDIVVESMGGKVPSVGISAKTGKGIEELLELVLLVAELEELKGDRAKPGQGVIVESYLDSHRGPTATMLLREGILRVGDIAATPTTLGKIKILENFQNEAVKEAFPSMPCVVIGFENVPQVGEKFEVYPDAESAQKYIAKKERKAKEGEVFFAEEGKKILNIILKADVQGSIEAVEQVLKSIPQEKVALRILKSEVGDIDEGDVKLVQSSKARILGFRVKTSSQAAVLAERDGVRILNFDIIYELAQEARQLMERMVSAEKVRINLGKLKILVIFKKENTRQVLGGKVIEGEVKKGSMVEGSGRLVNVQKNKKDVDRAIKGEECGILYEGDADIQEGDILSLYTEGYAKKDSAG